MDCPLTPAAPSALAAVLLKAAAAYAVGVVVAMTATVAARTAAADARAPRSGRGRVS